MSDDFKRDKSPGDSTDFQNAYFLGAYGENNELVESILLEFLRDHVFWRRNFHPEDAAPISTLYQYQPEYQRLVARMKQELHRLSAELKRSVPFFNPRYIGHMASDLILPGLLAELITTLYNPNNVSEEAATVTLRHEMVAARQLARMIGFNTDPSSKPCAWGHLTSGGTIANFESLWYLRAARFYPLALKAGLAKAPREIAWPEILLDIRDQRDDWWLANRSLEDAVRMQQAVVAALAETGDERLANSCLGLIEDERLENLGPSEFFRRHPDCQPPIVCVSVTAHYSWEKAMKVLGLGSAQLVTLPADAQMRMDLTALSGALEDAAANRIPVLAVIGILGTTEFGSVDPIDGIMHLRQGWRDKGLEFSVHVDAAWGGYLMSMFREADGSFSSKTQVREGLCYFPSDRTYDSFRAMAEVDSVTVDPHKLGFLPFGVGGIILRNGDVPEFVSQRAAYVFEEEQGVPGARPTATDQYRNLGKFIMEGSKPGAAAAAAYVTHQVLPLDRENFGQMVRRTIRIAEYFYERIYLLARAIRDTARVAVPFLPGTNLVCVGINPAGNESAKVMNAFMRRIYSHIAVHPDEPLQEREYFGSRTSVMRRNLTEEEAIHVAGQLGLAPGSFVREIADKERDADRLVLLRHTLMNPWLLQTDDGSNYVDRYCQYLEKLIREELAG